MSESRPVSDSIVEMTEIVFPNDANPMGKLMGGRVMQWVDACAAIAADSVCRACSTLLSTFSASAGGADALVQ